MKKCLSTGHVMYKSTLARNIVIPQSFITYIVIAPYQNSLCKEYNDSTISTDYNFLHYRAPPGRRLLRFQ
ncbi:MAG: hypothetical protein J7M18_04475 [Candidatus Eremiobacteraeota bacterium]|nr:hypothetical protein [Candidatus Eremiobacteraeota bacterium]